MKKTILVQASSRSKGDTRIVSDFICSNFSIDFLDLKKKEIRQYEYEKLLIEDDFITTIKYIIENSDQIIFITPVYWYTMSGILKTFLDRITDLLKDEKELGRKLRGKYLGIISSSNDEELDYTFDDPFKFSAGYLGMHYVGHVHCCIVDKRLTQSTEQKIKVYFDELTSE